MRAMAWWALPAIALGLLLGCSKEKAEPVATPVRTAVVETIDYGVPIRYSASIAAFTQVELGFKSGGLVQSLRQMKGSDGRIRSLQEGDWVAKGTVLASVRQDEYRDKVEQAKAVLARAQATYEHAGLDWQRAQTLFAQQALTKPDYDTAKAQYESAAASVQEHKAQLQQAELALRDCAIVAPVDAWVLKRNAEIGMVVNPMTTAFVVADTRNVKAVFGVPDLMLAHVKLGAKQSITVEAVPGAFEGKVTALSPAADPKSRVYSVEVTIPNLRNQLRAGMIASLEFAVETPAARQPAVELAAVVRHPQMANGYAVYVAEGEPATARVRTIEPGEPRGNRVVVVKGLKPGERVITTGATLVKDGDPVKIIP
jgi:RND family efflux transporter MFP subunit